jgi:hypothetical protein
MYFTLGFNQKRHSVLRFSLHRTLIASVLHPLEINRDSLLVLATYLVDHCTDPELLKLVYSHFPPDPYDEESLVDLQARSIELEARFLHAFGRFGGQSDLFLLAVLSKYRGAAITVLSGDTRSTYTPVPDQHRPAQVIVCQRTTEHGHYYCLPETSLPPTNTLVTPPMMPGNPVDEVIPKESVLDLPPTNPLLLLTPEFHAENTFDSKYVYLGGLPRFYNHLNKRVTVPLKDIELLVTMILVHLGLIDMKSNPLSTKQIFIPKVQGNTPINTFELIIELPTVTTFAFIGRPDEGAYEGLCTITRNKIRPIGNISENLAEAIRYLPFVFQALRDEDRRLLTLPPNRNFVLGHVRNIAVASSAVLAAEEIALRRNLQCIRQPFTIVPKVTYMTRTHRFPDPGTGVQVQNTANFTEYYFDIIVEGPPESKATLQKGFNLKPGTDLDQSPFTLEALRFSISNNTKLVPKEPAPRTSLIHPPTCASSSLAISLKTFPIF